DITRELAEHILMNSDPGMLDHLLGAGVAASSEPIATALFARAGDDTRTMSGRLSDARQVLPLLLAQNRLDEAEEVLDILECAAREGQGRDEYLAILANPTKYEPALSFLDARWSRIACLESAGRYDDAAHLLIEEFHRVLNGS